jgi:hypothetical protein
MALQKTIRIKGVDAAYHKILEVKQDIAENTTVVTIGSYVNKQARDESIGNFINIYAETFDFVDKEREDIYIELKTKERWLDAVDV